MSTFQDKPKQKSHYQHILSEAEKLRHQPPKKINLGAKAAWSKTVQRFSGKRGK